MLPPISWKEVNFVSTSCRWLQVSNVTKAGLYAPFTMSGDILVNGALASCHSEWILDDIIPNRYAHLLPAIYQVSDYAFAAALPSKVGSLP